MPPVEETTKRPLPAATPIGAVLAAALALSGCGDRSPVSGLAEADTAWVAPARWANFPLLPDGRFPIAGWCAPPVAETNDARYAEYAAAGFTVVMPALEDPYEEAANRARLAVAGRHGLWVLVRDDRVHPDEAYRGGWRGDVDEVVAAYRGHPALLGYFLADEPLPDLYPSLAVLNRRFAAFDTTRPAYVNLLGLSPRGHGPAGLTYAEYVERFVRETRPAFFSVDLYTLTEGGDTPNLIPGLDTVRIVARRHRTPWWAVLQLTPHRRLRTLREAELRWQAHLALAHGAKGIVWFTYWTPRPDDERYRDGPIAYDGARTPAYDAVAAVNAEIEPLGRELARLDPVDVRHANDLPEGARRLDGHKGLWVSSGEPVTVGFFAAPDGREHALVVNRDYRGTVRVVLESPGFLEPWRGEPGRYGRGVGHRMGGGAQLVVTLPPGGAKLYRLP